MFGVVDFKHQLLEKLDLQSKKYRIFLLADLNYFQFFPVSKFDIWTWKNEDCSPSLSYHKSTQKVVLIYS